MMSLPVWYHVLSRGGGIMSLPVWYHVVSSGGGYDVASCLVPCSFQGRGMMSLPVWSHVVSRGGGMMSLPVWFHVLSRGGGMMYRSGTLNSNTVNSKFLSNLCQIPIISCLKITLNSNTVNSK